MIRRRALLAAYLAGFVSCLVFLIYTTTNVRDRGTEGWFSFDNNFRLQSADRVAKLLSQRSSASDRMPFVAGQVQKERQERLRTVCASAPSRYNTLGTIFNVPDLGITYCCIAKCASTTFKTFLLVATRKSCADMGPHYCAQERFPVVTSFHEFLANSVIVVRNPWYRLVSAYINKFVSERIRFAKFCYEYHNMTLRGGPPVSFSQFVECVLNEVALGRELNPHIAPIHWHCDACRANYTFIATLETFDEDMDYLVRAVLPQTKTAEEYRRALGAVKRRKSEKSNQTTQTYEASYRSLNRQLLERLVPLYATDAQLYGYPAHPLDP